MSKSKVDKSSIPKERWLSEYDIYDILWLWRAPKMYVTKEDEQLQWENVHGKGKEYGHR